MSKWLIILSCLLGVFVIVARLLPTQVMTYGWGGIVVVGGSLAWVLARRIK